MSTFGGLSIAASGLSAARAALEVTGQNVANANTEGYTRQRVDQSPLAQTALATYFTQSSLGDGVNVTGVSRVNDAVVDARVNSTASSASYWNTTSTAVSSVETSLNEPTTSGLASQMSTFFNDWQTHGQQRRHDVGRPARRPRSSSRASWSPPRSRAATPPPRRAGRTRGAAAASTVDDDQRHGGEHRRPEHVDPVADRRPAAT